MKTIKNKGEMKTLNDQKVVSDPAAVADQRAVIDHAAGGDNIVRSAVDTNTAGGDNIVADPMTAVINTSGGDIDDHTAETPSSRTVAYARVSSRDQNLDRQIIALKQFGVDQIFMDKQSGKDFLRPAYQEMIGLLKPGDVLVVKSIDRLGRNYEEILAQWRIITKEKQVAIVVLDMPLLDTRNNRDLTGTLIADIVLQLLSYVAETERSLIKERQREGIAAAKARGQRFGRKPRDRGEEYPALRELWLRGEISAAEAGRRLGCTHNTFLKWVRGDQC